MAWCGAMPATIEQVDRILNNPLYRNMAGAMSGTQEYMAAETLHALHGDDRFDLVVVDTPPSRNALDFLEAPGVLARFLDHRSFKLLMLPTKSGLKVLGPAAQPILKAIGRIVGSDVLADSVAFFQAFAGMETGFRERADEVVALIRAPETSFVVVASPRHDTIDEAVWFAEQLVAQGVGVSAAIVNRSHPAFGVGSAAEATSVGRSGRRRRRSRGAVAERGRAAHVARTRARGDRAACATSPARDAVVDVAAARQRRARSRRAVDDRRTSLRRFVVVDGAVG